MAVRRMSNNVIEKVERIKVKQEAPRVFLIMEGMLVSLFVFQPSSQLLSFLHFCSFFRAYGKAGIRNPEPEPETETETETEPEPEPKK